MLGRYVTDLQVGDELGPVEHVLTPFLIREYSHAVEETSERFQGAEGSFAPPTILHPGKLRLLDHACPEGGGPTARLHLIYDATYHQMIPAASTLELGGGVVERFEHRGRERLVLEFEVRDKVTGTVYTTYRDTSLLGYRPNG